MSDKEDFGRMLALMVHDLRNPTATVGANVDFLRDVEIADQDAREALDDIGVAVEDLKRGLTMVGWIARWLSGDPAVSASDGDVVGAVRQVAANRQVELDLPSQPLLAKGGGAAAEILAVLLDNSGRHARNQVPSVAVFRDGEEVVVRMTDKGAAISETFRDNAFTVGAQSELKGRPDGRYARFCGWVAAGAVASTIGGRLVAGGEPGAATFELRLKSL